MLQIHISKRMQRHEGRKGRKKRRGKKEEGNKRKEEEEGNKRKEEEDRPVLREENEWAAVEAEAAKRKEEERKRQAEEQRHLENKVTFHAIHDAARENAAMYLTGSLESLGWWDVKCAPKMNSAQNVSWALAILAIFRRRRSSCTCTCCCRSKNSCCWRRCSALL